MKFCLKKERVEKFKQALREKKISPYELSRMTSKGRKEFFESIVGKDNAKKANALFQQKVVQKNKVKGIISWAKTIMGKNEPRADIVKKIKNLNEIQLNSDEFIDDLVEQRLGISLSEQEFGQLHKLSQEIADTRGVNTTKQLIEKLNDLGKNNKLITKLNKYVKKTAIEKEKKRLSSLENRLATTGSKKERSSLQKEIDISISKLREKSKETKKLFRQMEAKVDISENEKLQIRELVNEMVDRKYGGGGLAFGKAKVALQDATSEMINKSYWKDLRKGGIVSAAKKGIWEALKSSKGMKAMADFSAVGRQAKFVLFRHPIVWWKNAVKSAKAGASGLGERKYRALAMSDIYARENYAKGYYKKLDIGVDEEEFIKGMAEHIPGIKSVYNASEDAYVTMLQGSRADMMDIYIANAKRNGIEITEEFTDEASAMINRMTGRGTVPGQYDKAVNAVNALFFSPRKLLADFQYPFEVLRRRKNLSKEQSSFLRKQAAKNLVASAVGLAGVYSAAKTLWGDEVLESDPRSSDFGQIKIGSTRFDPTGGMKAPVVLAARLLTGEKKSSVSGKITKLGKSYDSGDVMDEVWGFGENRFSPVLRTAWNAGNRKGFSGDKYTYEQAAIDLFEPIPIETAIQAYNNPDPNQANIGAIIAADFLGVSANTYSLIKEEDWKAKADAGGVEMKQLLEKVGEDKFKEINEKYNKAIISEVASMLNNEKYKSLSVEDKRKEFLHLKKRVKERALKDSVGKWKFKRKKAEKFKSKL